MLAADYGAWATTSVRSGPDLTEEPAGILHFSTAPNSVTTIIPLVFCGLMHSLDFTLKALIEVVLHQCLMTVFSPWYVRERIRMLLLHRMDFQLCIKQL